MVHAHLAKGVVGSTAWVLRACLRLSQEDHARGATQRAECERQGGSREGSDAR